MIRNAARLVLLVVLGTSLIGQQTPITTSAQSPANAPAQATSSGPPAANTLLDGTPVKLRLSQTISSSDAKAGQEIPFEVVEEIKVDGVAVLPKGATAIGTVTEANAKKSMGRAGKLNLTVSYARLADQEKVALRAVKDSKGGGHVGAVTGAIVATSIVFFPAAPLFLFIHGKDVTIPQGTEITAFVEGERQLDMTRFGAVAATSAQAAAPAAVPATTSADSQASLSIDSTPTGADIEVDGEFMGNTPSTITIPVGNHEIVMKKKGFSSWTRKMNVNGGSVHVAAELEQAPSQ
jgi:hypothetical protein